MFYTANFYDKHWRAHLEKLFREFIWRGHLESMQQLYWHKHPMDPCLTLKGPPKDPLMEPQWSLMQGVLKVPQLLWIASSNGLSMWALRCLFTFGNITNLDCNSNYNYLVLYSILFLPMSTINIDSTSYYQWDWQGWYNHRTAIWS